MQCDYGLKLGCSSHSRRFLLVGSGCGASAKRESLSVMSATAFPGAVSLTKACSQLVANQFLSRLWFIARLWLFPVS